MSDDELEPLITECPGCRTRFRVAEAQLQRAGGKVRCGACLTVFHGVDHLTFESAQTYASEEHAQRALDALLDELAGPGGAGDGDGTAAADTRGPAPAHTPAPPELDPGRDAATASALAPSFTSPPASAPRPPLRREPPAAPIFSGFEEPAGAEAARNYVFQVLEDPERGPAAAAGEAPAPADAEDAAVERDATEPGTAKPDSAAPDAAEPGTAPDTAKAETAPDTAKAGDGERGEAAAPAAEAAAQDVSPERSKDSGTAATTAPGGPVEAAPVVFGDVRRRRPLVWAGILAGLVLLVAQVLWYQFDDWSKDPQWRGVYVALCGVLGCELPPLRDRSLLATRNLAVRSHPERDGELLVNAVIVNQAEFAQPFPVLELRFTTVQGTLVAGRRFAPEDYLAGEASSMTLIPPRTPVQVELTIDDPGPAAVNYFLRFR